MRVPVALVFALAAAAWSAAAVVVAQRSDAFGASRDHPAIAYSTAPVSNAVTALNEALRSGKRTLEFDPKNGYLQSVLDALSVPVESQLLVYTQTSFAGKLIGEKNPRAIYFRDGLAVAWVRGADLLELAVQDPRQGAIFYTIPQSETKTPAFSRDDQCLQCHLTWDTRAVPGLFVQTVYPRRNDAEYANGYVVDHRAPIDERWGGWYVTGAQVPRSMGNLPLFMPKMPEGGPSPVPARASVKGAFDLSGYPTPYSDVAALMVFDHQAHATNLITRAGWEYRIKSPHVQEAVDELADYLLFVDEAPLPEPIKGNAGFAERFAAEGPRDRKGRSLRELDLQTRLMRYPLSYMIYSPGFNGLPPEVRSAVFERIDTVLAGKDPDPKYKHLTPPLRKAIAEILADTVTRPATR